MKPTNGLLSCATKPAKLSNGFMARKKLKALQYTGVVDV